MFEIKECINCGVSLPLGYYHKNGRAGVSEKGRWAWCKRCEQKAKWYEKKGDMSHVVMFSGGKDSTAMLLKMLEKNHPIDIIIYMDCGNWEWSEMEIHINQVEKMINRKITKVSPYPHGFDYMMTEHKPEGKKEFNGWPTPNMRWCTLMKVNTIRKYLRQYRPYYAYIGYAVDEPQRVIKQENSHHNLIDSGKQINKFPLIEMKMTEDDCLKYCYKKGFTWGGLYKYHKRVSCWCCPLQKIGDLRILCRDYPELWKRLKKMDSKTKNNFRMNNPDIFNRIESEVKNGKG